MSFNFTDQCSPKHIEAVQKSIDACRDKNDNAGMRKWVLYLGTLKTKCGIIERSCEGCSPTTQRINPCKSCKATPPEAMHTMHGFEEFELVENANGEIIGLKTPEKTPKPTPQEPLEHQSALLFHSRNQTRTTEIEK